MRRLAALLVAGLAWVASGCWGSCCGWQSECGAGPTTGCAPVTYCVPGTAARASNSVYPAMCCPPNAGNPCYY